MTHTTKPTPKLQLSSAVTYQGLPTQVISGPRMMMGIEVVLLAYVPWPVPTNSPELQLMEQPRQATDEEINLHLQRNKESKQKS